MEIVGYHTCKKTNDVLEKAPFLSGCSDRIWLTQGYYFWTDDIYHAHKWGKSSIEGNYSIVKCLINLDEEKDELLDLVGNISQQIYFDALIKKFMKEFKDENITIRTVIMFLRNKALKNSEIFPFIAFPHFIFNFSADNTSIFLSNFSSFTNILSSSSLGNLPFLFL